MRIHDLRCESCGAIETDVFVYGDGFPTCGLCGGPRTWVPAAVRTDAWGSPTYVTSLDREFASRSDLRKYLRENGLSEAGDRVGGARNESHLHLGRAFSYAGQTERVSTAERSAGRPRRAGKG